MNIMTGFAYLMFFNKKIPKVNHMVRKVR